MTGRVETTPRSISIGRPRDKLSIVHRGHDWFDVLIHIDEVKICFNLSGADLRALAEWALMNVEPKAVAK